MNTPSFDEMTAEQIESYLQQSMPANIYEAHKHSINHKAELAESDICGCFSCLSIYGPREIEEWIQDDDGEAAICPHCGVDSVIGNASGHPITPEFLAEMKQHWFADV